VTNPRTGQDATRCAACAARAERDISDERKAGRSTFADLLHDFFKANRARNVGLVARWAGLWDVSESKVRQWANGLVAHSTITCGDVQALPVNDRLALLRYWVERAEAELAPVAPMQDPRHVSLRAVVLAAKVAEEASAIMADGAMSHAESVQFEALCERGEQLFHSAKLAARAVRGER